MSAQTTLKLDWNGKHYSLDLESIDADEFDIIEDATGCTLTDLMGEGNIGRVRVLRSLRWLFFRRAGENIDIEENFEVVPFLQALEASNQDKAPKGNRAQRRAAERGPKAEKTSPGSDASPSGPSETSEA